MNTKEPKKGRKSILSVFLIICLIVGLAPHISFAEETGTTTLDVEQNASLEDENPPDDEGVTIPAENEDENAISTDIQSNDSAGQEDIVDALGVLGDPLPPLGAYNPSLTFTDKWSTSADAFDRTQYDTVQTGETFLLSIGFAIDAAYTEKTVKVNIPRGLEVKTYTGTSGSPFISNVAKTGNYNQDAGTTLTYTLVESASGNGGIQIEIKNNGGNVLYGPGTDIPVTVTYGYKDAGTPATATATYNLTVKPYDLKRNGLSGVHFLGTYGNSGNQYHNGDLEICSLDNAWYETEALRAGISETQLILFTSDEIARDRQSATMGLSVTIPLPAGLSFVDANEIYNLKGSSTNYSAVNDYTKNYETSYNAGTHTLTVTLKKNADGTIIRNSPNFTGGPSTAATTAAGVYEYLLPLALQDTGATDGATYTASQNIVYHATDVNGTVHDIDSGQALTVHTTTRASADSFNPTTANGNNTAYVGDSANMTIASVNLKRDPATLTERPLLYNNAVFTFEIPDGFDPKAVSWEGFDTRGARTPFKATVKYKTKENPSPQVLTVIDSTSAHIDPRVNTLNFPTLAAGDVVTTVYLELDQLGTAKNSQGGAYFFSGVGREPLFKVLGVGSTAYRNGSTVADSDTRSGTVTFAADNLAAKSKTYTTTYKVLVDKLNLYSRNATDRSKYNGMVETVSDTYTAPMYVYVDNPLGALQHHNVDVTVKPVNGIKITSFGIPIIPATDTMTSFTGATVKLSNGDDFVWTDLNTTVYKAPAGVYVEEIVYHASYLNSDISGWTNAIRLPLDIWAPHGDYPDDGTVSNDGGITTLTTGTKVLELTATSTERPLAAPATYGVMKILDHLNCMLAGSLGGATYYFGKISSSPASATVGDGTQFVVSAPFSLDLSVRYTNTPSEVYAAAANSSGVLNEYQIQPTGFNLYYKITKDFDYVDGSADPSLFGTGATVTSTVTPNYFADGSSLLKLQYDHITRYLSTDSSGLPNMPVKFGLKASITATPGVNRDAVTDWWYEIDGHDLERDIPIKTGEGSVRILSPGYTDNARDRAVDEYDVNQNGDKTEFIGKNDYIAPLQLTLVERLEAGGFNYGASKANPVLGPGPYRGWADETFTYQFNIIAKLNSDLDHFVAYIPISQLGANPNGKLPEPNQFDFELASWPDFNALGLGGNYTVYWSTDADATMGGLTGGTDANYQTGTPSDPAKVTMVKLVSDKVPIGTNDFIPLELKVKGGKPAGNPNAYMMTFFKYDQISSAANTNPVKYTLEKASVSGTVWLDVNRNGVRDGGDTTLAGVTVNLYTADPLHTKVGTISSGSDGSYSLEASFKGNYFIEVETPTGKYLVNRSIDSIINPATAQSDPISLGLTPVTGQNIGLFIPVYTYTINYYQDFVTSPGDSTTFLGTQTGVSAFEAGHQLTASDIIADRGQGWLNAYKPSGNYNDGFAQNLPLAITSTPANNVINVLYLRANNYVYSITYVDLGWYIESSTTTNGQGFIAQPVTITTETITGQSLGNTLSLTQAQINKYKPSSRYESGVCDKQSITITSDPATNHFTVTYLKRNTPPVVSVTQNTLYLRTSDYLTLLETLQRAGTRAWDKEDGTYTLSRVRVQGWDKVMFGVVNNTGDPYLLTLTVVDNDGWISNVVTIAVFVVPDDEEIPVTPPPVTPPTPFPPDPSSFTTDIIENTIGALTAPLLSSVIGPDETPLAQREHDFCWVHHYILLGIIISSMYAVIVVSRRRWFTKALMHYEYELVEESGEDFTESKALTGMQTASFS